MSYQNLYHPSDCEYLCMSFDVIDCKIEWLCPELCLFQSLAIHLSYIYKKYEKRFRFCLKMALSWVEMTQQIMVIQQNLRFPMLFLFYFPYWTYDCGFRWIEHLGKASSLTVLHLQFVSSSLFDCYSVEQERPLPLLQATVCYVPAALCIQPSFSALPSLSSLGFETSSTQCGVALFSLLPYKAP